MDSRFQKIHTFPNASPWLCFFITRDSASELCSGRLDFVWTSTCSQSENVYFKDFVHTTFMLKDFLGGCQFNICYFHKWPLLTWLNMHTRVQSWLKTAALQYLEAHLHIHHESQLMHFHLFWVPYGWQGEVQCPSSTLSGLCRKLHYKQAKDPKTKNA